MTSDFRPEVEMRLFRACAVKKNMQYSLYLWSYRQNFRVIKKIWVENSDVNMEFFQNPVIKCEDPVKIRISDFI